MRKHALMVAAIAAAAALPMLAAAPASAVPQITPNRRRRPYVPPKPPSTEIQEWNARVDARKAERKARRIREAA